MVIPPPLIHKFFRYQKFCETEGTPYEVFRSCETKNFRQNHDAPPPMHENFRYKNFFETQKGSPTKFFGTVRQKFSTQNRDIPFSCKKLFR